VPNSDDDEAAAAHLVPLLLQQMQPPVLLLLINEGREGGRLFRFASPGKSVLFFQAATLSWPTNG
jgi:hypothetical protein